MATLTAYLFFNNNCREAMNFYQKVFGGDLKVMSMGESPMKDQMPPEAQDLIMHAYLMAPGFALMASDGSPDKPPVTGDAISLAIGADSVEEAEKIYKELSAGGKITMELQETFWAHRYGQLVDKYGINWMVSYNKPM